MKTLPFLFMFLMTIQKIKVDFLKDAIEYGDAIGVGNHKLANMANKRLQSLYIQAKEQQNENIFEAFLTDNNDNVRLWAAVFSLRNNPDTALEVLRKLTKRTTIVAITARITIENYHSGKLNLL